LDLKAYLADRRRLVDSALDEALPSAEGPAGRVVEAMRYSVVAGGKRLRPILCLAGAEAVGGRAESALPAAVALELIHTYSLIHDDLPAMDDDDLRRGRPTSHKVFGEALAILAGDALLTAGLGHLARKGVEGALDPGRSLAVLDLLARAAGWDGMVGGQAADMEAEGREVDEAAVAYIHRRKTGALIAASVVSGGLSAGGNAGQIQALDAYGGRIGWAFQIVDDILDVEGNTDELGKTAGADEARGKATYPKAVGLDQAYAQARLLIDESIGYLAEFGPSAEPLRAIAGYLLARKK